MITFDWKKHVISLSVATVEYDTRNPTVSSARIHQNPAPIPAPHSAMAGTLIASKPVLGMGNDIFNDAMKVRMIVFVDEQNVKT
jgi:hypothetical protein